MAEEERDDHRTRAGWGYSDEWIEKIAESEDIDREEVIDRLVSSYWTLKEMHGLLEQTETDIDLDEGEWPPSFEGLLSEAVGQDLGALEERVAQLEAGQAEELDDPAIESLEERVQRLETRLADTAQTIRAKQGSFEARFDEEFENLETVLDYLIETTDDLQSEVEAASGERTEARRFRAEQRQLSEIKGLASRLGVSKARCEYCDTAVDISLLPRPECPQCDRRFTDVDPGKRWFGLEPARLRVTDDPYVGDDEDD